MKYILEWHPFSKEEFRNVIKKCSSSSTLEPNHISWWYFKILVDDNKYISNFVNIANIYINLNYWLLYFKMSTLIIIPKPNKVTYDSLKTFWPIVLFNMLGKFIKKVISERLQTQSIFFNFIHSNQLEWLKQYTTTDASLFLTYLICTSCVKGLHTSTLAFDITQFFSLLNLLLLLLISRQSWFQFKSLVFLF